MPASAPSWDFDPAGDQLLVDGQEVVEYRPQLSGGTFGPAVYVPAVRETVNRRLAAVLLEYATLVFHLLDLSEIDTARGVLKGDRITDHAGKVYAVTESVLQGAGDQVMAPTVEAG